MKMNKNEQAIFWYGILLGVTGGTLGGLFSNALFNFINKPQIIPGIILIIFLFLLLFILYLIHKNLKEIKNIKPGRPKSK